MAADIRVIHPSMQSRTQYQQDIAAHVRSGFKFQIHVISVVLVQPM